MDIGNVLSRAWQIIWKHKILWIFGILASCAGGNGGGSSSASSSYRFDRSDEFGRYFSNIPIPEWLIALIVVAVIAVIFVLILLAVFLSTVGRIGLIRGTLQAEKETEALEFGELFRSSLPYFWRVFGLNLLVGLVVFLATMVILLMAGIGVFMTLGIGLICVLPLLCLFVPISWFVSVIVEQAIIAVVIEDRGIMEGLQAGWKIVRENIGTYIIMALILVLGVSVVEAIFAMPLVLVVVPPLLAYLTGIGEMAGIVTAGIFALIYILFLIVISGILTSFTGVSWTLTYLRLSGASEETALEASEV